MEKTVRERPILTLAAVALESALRLHLSQGICQNTVMGIALPAFARPHLEQVGVHGRVPAVQADAIDLAVAERTMFARVEDQGRVLFARCAIHRSEGDDEEDDAGIHVHLEVVTAAYFDGEEPDADSSWKEIEDAIDRLDGLSFEGDAFTGYEMPIRELPHGSVITPLLMLNVRSDDASAHLVQGTFQLDMGEATGLRIWFSSSDEPEVGAIVTGRAPKSVTSNLLTSSEAALQPAFETFILAKQRLKVAPKRTEVAHA